MHELRSATAVLRRVASRNGPVLARSCSGQGLDVHASSKTRGGRVRRDAWPGIVLALQLVATAACSGAGGSKAAGSVEAAGRSSDHHIQATDTHRAEHVIRRTYHCPAGAEVVFMIIQGGGHSWPGSAFSASIAKIVGPTTTEIDATREIWQFSQHCRLPSES